MTNKTTPKFVIINAPMPVSQYPIKSTHTMNDPIGITIHETDNNASARNEAAYMQRNIAWTSFHWVVDENEIINCAPMDRNTWHAGDGSGKGNMKTISIEICRNYRVSDYNNYYKARANAEKLVGWLMYIFDFNTNQIYMHRDWSGKHCPRVMIDQGYFPSFKQNAEAHKNSYKVATTAPITQPTQSFTSVSVGQKVKIKDDAAKYANVDKAIPSWVKNQTHTVYQVDNNNQRALLKEIFSWVRFADLAGYQGSAANPTPQPTTIKVGDMVTVKQGAKSYEGATVISDWYRVPKRVDSLYGNRAVLDINNWITAFNVNDLVKASAATSPAAPAPKPAPTPAPTQIKVGTQVTATGQVFGDSYGGRYGGTTTVTGQVTYHNPNGTKPYHVGKVGWFAAKDVKAVGAAPAPAPAPKPAPKAIGRGSRVYVTGQVFGDSYGGRPGITINQYGYVTYINPGAPKPYHIDNLGWVAAKDVK